MSKRIYIGNLNFETTEDSLNTTFSKFGSVLSATIIKDKNTGSSKGFGFVEMEDGDCADKAIFAMNGKTLDGRRVRVGEAIRKITFLWKQ